MPRRNDTTNLWIYSIVSQDAFTLACFIRLIYRKWTVWHVEIAGYCLGIVRESWCKSVGKGRRVKNCRASWYRQSRKQTDPMSLGTHSGISCYYYFFFGGKRWQMKRRMTRRTRLDKDLGSRFAARQSVPSFCSPFPEGTSRKSRHWFPGWNEAERGDRMPPDGLPGRMPNAEMGIFIIIFFLRGVFAEIAQSGPDTSRSGRHSERTKLAKIVLIEVPARWSTCCRKW